MKKSIWAWGSCLILSIDGILVFATLQEWYIVSYLEQTAEYPFGGEGPVPYYYKDPALYATVNLSWGIFFLIVLLLAFLAVIKRNRKVFLISVVLSVILLIAYSVQG